MSKHSTYIAARDELKAELDDLDYQMANVEDHGASPGEEEELEHEMELVRIKLDKLEADYEDSH